MRKAAAARKKKLDGLLVAVEKKGWSKCATCKLDGVADVIRWYLESRAERRSTLSLSKFHAEILRPEYDYPLTLAAFRNHVERCEPELLKRIRGHGRA